MQVIQRQQDLADYDCSFDIVQPPALVLDIGEQVSCCDELLEKITAALSRCLETLVPNSHGIRGLDHFLDANYIRLHGD
jgi:hypothetical protein